MSTPKDTKSISIRSQKLQFGASADAEAKTLDYIANNERDVISGLLDSIQRDDVVYDIGSNIGVHTCFAAATDRARTVVAFEPYEPNVAALKRNLAINDLDAEVVPQPLNDETTKVPFKRPAEPEPGHQISAIYPENNATTELRQAVRGADLVTNGEIPPPNVVKIDVEGADLKVIRGLEDLLAKQACHTVFCEVHLPSWVDRPAVTDFGAEATEIELTLRDLGFDVERFQEVEKGYHLKAVKYAGRTG